MACMPLLKSNIRIHTRAQYTKTQAHTRAHTQTHTQTELGT